MLPLKNLARKGLTEISKIPYIRRNVMCEIFIYTMFSNWYALIKSAIYSQKPTTNILTVGIEYIPVFCSSMQTIIYLAESSLYLFINVKWPYLVFEIELA